MSSTWISINLQKGMTDKQEEVLAAELLEWFAGRGHRQFAVGVMGDSLSLRVPRLTLGVKGEEGVTLSKDDYWSECSPS